MPNLKLTPSQQKEYDKLDELRKLMYEPKIIYTADVGALKELYSGYIFDDLVFKDNPFLKMTKNYGGYAGKTFKIGNK